MTAVAAAQAPRATQRPYEGSDPTVASRLLLVEDDVRLRAQIADYLRRNGFDVAEAGDAKGMDRLLAGGDVDLIILDVRLPGEDGLSVCRRLSDGAGPPILMLSAAAEDVDRILGIELGADDYLAKPVNPRELLARTRALLRRRSGEPRAPAVATGRRFCGFRADLTRRQLRAPDGSLLTITPGEFSLLCAFLEHPRQVLSRDRLLDYARGDGAEVFDRAVDVQVSRLRRKLSLYAGGDLIRTHRGVGYLLDAAVEPA